MDTIKCKEEERYDLLHGAIKLFSEIDINGDGNMEWSELMQYMIDQVGASAVPSSDSGENQSVVQMLSQMKENQSKKFFIA